MDMFQEADLAITDLTITSEREEAVDFTTPFMNLGKKPQLLNPLGIMFFRYKHLVPKAEESSAKLLLFRCTIRCGSVGYVSSGIFHRFHLAFYHRTILSRRMD